MAIVVVAIASGNKDWLNLSQVLVFTVKDLAWYRLGWYLLEMVK